MSFVPNVRRPLEQPFRTGGPQQAQDLTRAGAIRLDVRGAAEWRAGRAAGARHLPLGDLAQRIGEIPSGRTVVVVCRSGVRSVRTTALLAGHQIEAVSLGGGTPAWERAGLPAVADEGRAGRMG